MVKLRIYEFTSIVLVSVLCGIQFLSHLQRYFSFGSIDKIGVKVVTENVVEFQQQQHNFQNTIPTRTRTQSQHHHEEQVALQGYSSVTATTTTPATTSTSTLQSSTRNTINGTNPSNNNDGKDWFQKTQWRPNLTKNTCFYVENLCHSSQVWFYDQRGVNVIDKENYYNDDNQRLPLPTVDNQIPHQPHPLTLILRQASSSSSSSTTTRKIGFPAYIDNITIHSKIPPNMQVAKCRYSPIINHMVFQSNFNDMLGEFYSRSLIGLWQLVKEIHHFQDKGEQQEQEQLLGTQQQILMSPRDPHIPDNYNYYETMTKHWDDTFMIHTQMYLHMNFHFRKYISPILESHRLFMDIFTSNPILDFRTLLDHGGCRCLKRLIFCGYQSDPSRRTTNPQSAPHQDDIDDGEEFVILAKKVTNVVYDELTSQPTQLERHGYQLLRDTLLHHMIDRNPQMQELIQTTRYAHLKRINVLDRNSTYFAVNSPELKTLLAEWTIIGLSQRTKRRKWLNAPDIQNECNKRFLSYKIACVTVDIEDYIWSNPLKHLAAHASLDGLIGIHGAQLTEALWLPRGSLVVELLPWIPISVEVGRWTNWVHRPTPLGVIYKETDLNHIGYPLTRASAGWYCNGRNFTSACFGKIENYWGNRDFVANITLVEDILTKFVLATNPRNELPSCDDFVERAANEYVLYNVRCVNDTIMGIHHYYREQDWIKNKRIEARRRYFVEAQRRRGHLQNLTT